MKQKLLNVIESCKKANIKGNSPISYISSKVKADKELYSFLLEFSKSLDLYQKNRLIEIIYNYVTGTRRPKCKVCGKPTKFLTFEKGYGSTCSLKCSHRTKEYRQSASKIHKGRKSPLKGKTYLEIYGTLTPSCGYQKGSKNIAKRTDIRKKISKGVKNSYTPELLQKRREEAYKRKFYKGSFKKKFYDDYGNYFRSTLESNFSNFLHKNGIEFEYEKEVKLLNGKRKIVDFVIDNKVYIEISGYAYRAWKDDFNLKVNYLRETLDSSKIIFILTYSKNLTEMYLANLGDNIFVGSIEDEIQILKTLNFINSIIYINENTNLR